VILQRQICLGKNEECPDGAERAEVEPVQVQHLRQGEGAEGHERCQVNKVGWCHFLYETVWLQVLSESFQVELNLSEFTYPGRTYPS